MSATTKALSRPARGRAASAAHVVAAGVVWLAACGGDDGPPVEVPVDADPADAIVDYTCEPDQAAGMQHCQAGQKCTWIVLQEEPARVGWLSCAPDGTMAIDEACAYGPPSQATGHDDCVAGTICDDGRCVRVCALDAQPGVGCAQDEACVERAGLFANGEDAPEYGVCIEIPR